MHILWLIVAQQSAGAKQHRQPLAGQQVDLK